MQSQQLTPPYQPELEDPRQQRRDTRAARRTQRRRARILLISTTAMTIILLGFLGFFYLRIQSLLNPPYPAINGVSCDSTQYNTYHIHVHLTIYINGKPVTIPEGIGIASDGSCYYWMHTHSSDGIIHIEAPAKVHNVALDDFLTIWHDGFSKLNFPPQLTLNSGWHIYVNGKPFAGQVTSPLNTEVALSSHDLITLEYGSNNPPPEKPGTFSFPIGE